MMRNASSSMKSTLFPLTKFRFGTLIDWLSCPIYLVHLYAFAVDARDFNMLILTSATLAVSEHLMWDYRDLERRQKFICFSKFLVDLLWISSSVLSQKIVSAIAGLKNIE